MSGPTLTAEQLNQIIRTARQDFYAAFDKECPLELGRESERKLAEIFESSVLNAILQRRVDWSTDVVRKDFALARVRDIAQMAVKSVNGKGLTPDLLDSATSFVVTKFRKVCPDHRLRRAIDTEPGEDEEEAVFCLGFR